MCQRIFRLVYCSRSLLSGSDAEVRGELKIMLRVARRNNAQAGVTGALFFNTVFFAQALEGDYVQVQRVFGCLQRDPRHAQVTILHCGFAAGRDFGDWSMAFQGASAEVALPFGDTPRSEAEFTGSSRNGERVLHFLRENVVRQEAWTAPLKPSPPLPLLPATQELVSPLLVASLGVDRA